VNNLVEHLFDYLFRRDVELSIFASPHLFTRRGTSNQLEYDCAN
jgi:hypothetical protein